MNSTLRSKIIAKAYEGVKSALIEHYQFLFNYFDPIKDVCHDDSTLKGNSYLNRHFIFPTIVVLLTVVQGLIGFGTDEEEEAGIRFSESKRFVTHQIFPKEFWFLSDILVAFSLSLITICHLCLLCFPLLHSDCFLYLNHSRNNTTSNAKRRIDPRQVLTQEESYKISLFRNKIKLTVKVIFLLWIVGLFFYFTQQMTRNESIVISGGSVLYWAVLIPLFLAYAVYVELLMAIYFILTCKYIKIRQNSILERLETLKRRSEQKLEASSNPKPKEVPKPLSSTLIYHQFVHLNRHSIHICRYISLSNLFWSRYLTLFFTLYTFFICYCAYIILLGNVTFGQKSLFLGVMVYSGAMLLVIIKQCADIVWKNVLITRYNTFFVRVFQLERIGNVRKALKAETVTLALWEKPAEENAAAIYGYRLINDYRVDFGTFYFAFYNMSVFFMLNFRT